MKRISVINSIFFIFVILCFSSCGQGSGDKLNLKNVRGAYLEKFDPIADVGQYTFPEMTVKPSQYWSVMNALDRTRNDLGRTNSGEGLQYHLLCQSISGLVNRAVDEGKSKVGVWLNDPENRESYALSLQALNDMGIFEQGKQTGLELALNDYDLVGGVDVQIKNLFDGYVLTDVENNPESAIVASVASHVYNAIIVDARDRAIFDAAGYTMKYDAREKTTRDSWSEFRDKCSNKALVVMPVQTAELRDFAIKNNLFVLNVNRLRNDARSGQNLDIFEEALKWLEPGAPVYGWEQGIGEDVFVNRASRTGNVWIPSDWCYNIPMTSLQYSTRQTQVLAKVLNPKNIDYSKQKNFVSFYLSDGDNIQWMMSRFVEQYFLNEDAAVMKMGFGIPVGNLAMISQPQFANILNRQKDEYTVMETLGGGYMYADNYGIDRNRPDELTSLAHSVGTFMRQHSVKILGLMAKDVFSEEATRGYQAFVDANDMLEAIVVLQYSPYAGGEGEIFWLKNKNGFDIPIINARYSIWNFRNRNTPRGGTPAFIADRLKSEAADISFSIISVHAWSSFRDVGQTDDFLAENQGGNRRGASAAKLLANHLDERFEVVNIQELVWRARMHYREDQTKKYLKAIH